MIIVTNQHMTVGMHKYFIWFLISLRKTFLFDRENQEDDVKSTDQCPDFLSPEQHQLLSGKPSLKGVMDRLHETKLKMILQVNKFL